MGVYNNAMKKELQKKAMTQLSRIEGQVRGLQKMVEDEAYCIDIITQSSAVKSSLSSVEDLLLKNHLETHVMEQIENGKKKQPIEEILKVYKLKRK